MSHDLIHRFVSEDLASQCRIHVVGDVMIDEYHDVEVSRISPEFPIPVMKSRHDRGKRVPGGAANVACQFFNFNVQTYLTGITMPLTPFIHTRNLTLTQPGCSSNLPIPTKKRYYQNGFPVARWDIEEEFYGLGGEMIGGLFSKTDMPDAQVTIFSDYNKGIFNDMWFQQHLIDRVTIVDPKNDVEKWKGCTVLKPNSVEAEAITGTKDWVRQAHTLREMTSCRDVVITQGGDGVVGLTPAGCFEYRPSRATEDVQSVIGAGDCFVAFLAMALARGWTTCDAAGLAFEAGAVYVQTKLNRPLKPAELIARRRGEKVVFTNGCFDLLHAGHIHTLEYARQQGDILVVGVNSDDSAKRLKGESRPVNRLEDRAKLLEAMRCVDCVITFDEDTPSDLIKYVRPDVVVKGGDYQRDDVVGSDIAEVVIAPTVHGISTTDLISRVKSSA